MSNVSNSCIHEVRTSLKKFTVHFPCAVFTQEHVFNHILKAIDGFDFSDQQQFESIAGINEKSWFRKRTKKRRCISVLVARTS